MQAKFKHRDPSHCRIYFHHGSNEKKSDRNVYIAWNIYYLYTVLFYCTIMTVSSHNASWLKKYEAAIMNSLLIILILTKIFHIKELTIVVLQYGLKWMLMNGTEQRGLAEQETKKSESRTYCLEYFRWSKKWFWEWRKQTRWNQNQNQTISNPWFRDRFRCEKKTNRIKIPLRDF